MIPPGAAPTLTSCVQDGMKNKEKELLEYLNNFEDSDAWQRLERYYGEQRDFEKALHYYHKTLTAEHVTEITREQAQERITQLSRNNGCARQRDQRRTG